MPPHPKGPGKEREVNVSFCTLQWRKQKLKMFIWIFPSIVRKVELSKCLNKMNLKRTWKISQRFDIFGFNLHVVSMFYTSHLWYWFGSLFVSHKSNINMFCSWHSIIQLIHELLLTLHITAINKYKYKYVEEGRRVGKGWVDVIPRLVMMQQFIQMILHYKILDSHQLKPFNICCGWAQAAALPVMTSDEAPCRSRAAFFSALTSDEVAWQHDSLSPGAWHACHCSRRGSDEAPCRSRAAFSVAGPSRLSLSSQWQPGPDTGAGCELRAQSLTDGAPCRSRAAFFSLLHQQDTQSFSVTLYRDTIIPRVYSSDNNVVTTACLRDGGWVLGHCSVERSEPAQAIHW